MHPLNQSLVSFFHVLVSPTKWRVTVENSDNNLLPNFALCDLSIQQIRKPAVRKILIYSLIFFPLSIFAISILLLWAFNSSLSGALTAFLFVYMLTLTAAVYVSVPAGMLFYGVGTLLIFFQWSGNNVLVFDLVTSHKLSALFGCWSACTIAAASSHTVKRTEFSTIRQAGAIVLGLIIGLPLAAIIAYGIFMNTASRQSGVMDGSVLIWTMVIPPLVLLSLSVFIRTRKFYRLIGPAIFCVTVVTTGFGDLGYEYDRGAGGDSLTIASFTVIASTFCLVSILPYALVMPFVGGWAATISGAIGGLTIHYGLLVSYTLYPLITNLMTAVAFILGGVFFRQLWSVIAYPFEAAWNRALLETEYRTGGPPQHFNKHSAQWDEIQMLPLYELDDYLAEIASHDKSLGVKYIDRISNSNQRWAAQSALLELDARHLESLSTIRELTHTQYDYAAGLLDTSGGLILKSFTRFGSDISTALAQPTSYNRTLVIRTILKDIENLQLELARNLKDKNSRRFIPVCKHWIGILTRFQQRAEAQSKASNEIPNPYTVGAPLTRKQKIFVGRTDIARFLENILKQQDHPPLLLYGPRRMGKTSLLYQLHWMLPRHILTLIVDLQGPVGLAQDHSGFVYALIRSMCRAAARANIELTSLPREDLNKDPFIKFDDWLNTIESEMLTQGCDTMLLALDEFEALDIALREGTLRDHAVLGMLRHVAQHRARIKIMLVGSHTLVDFKRWATYFVNAQVIELGYLSSSEAKQLIEQPIAGYPLDYHPDASQRIFEFTRGHPYLVQLTCAELIALKNSQPESQRQIATVHDIDLCIPLILQRGQQFFTDIELNQMDDAGRELVSFLAASGDSGATKRAIATALPALRHSDTLQTLEQRNIIEQADGRYQFQVEAVRLWFDDSVNRYTA